MQIENGQFVLRRSTQAFRTSTQKKALLNDIQEKSDDSLTDSLGSDDEQEEDEEKKEPKANEVASPSFSLPKVVQEEPALIGPLRL